MRDGTSTDNPGSPIYPELSAQKLSYPSSFYLLVTFRTQLHASLLLIFFLLVSIFALLTSSIAVPSADAPRQFVCSE
jgi:hypothetical protein